MYNLEQSKWRNAWPNWLEEYSSLNKKFDVISAKKVDHFEMTLKETAHYVRKKFKGGPDIRITIIGGGRHSNINKTEETAHNWT